MNSRLVRLSAVIATLALIAGCSWFSDKPADGFAAFTAALKAKDAAAAASHTTDPAAATPVISAMFDGMGKAATVDVTTGPVNEGSGDPTSTLTYTWSFGPGKQLHYDATATATQSGDHWLLKWSPTVLHPKLTAGAAFQYSDDKNFLTPVVDRDGQPLLNWQTVGVVNLTRDQLVSAPALAALLGGFGITTESIQQQFAATADNTVTVIRLRSADLDPIADQLKAIPGVSVAEQGALLTTDQQMSSPLLSGLEPLWRTAIDATAGWSVDLVDRTGAPIAELASTPPRDTAPIRTTIDSRMQLLAQQAVAAEQRPAALVAIAPSTGGLLAVAQNAAADAQGPIALTGLYPPGSTFKTITTAAAMTAGLANPDTAVQCPGTITIENRTIPNEDEFDLGTVPLSTAFAHSCNTSMAALADRLPPDALGKTAKLFGIGVDYVIPGITTVTGQVPDADTPAQRVENGIGQGTVTASPFGLAVAEASLAHGSTILPTLVIGDTSTADTPSAPIPPAVADGLRAMMTQTVTDGTATQLRDIPGLGGKTGTAEYGDNTHSHGWFAGIDGDIAFATLVVGGDSSTPAVDITGTFLRAVTAPQ